MKPLLIILLLCIPSMAATRYVSPSGSGSGSCLTTETACTPARAVVASSPGDTVHVIASGIVQADTFTFGPAGTSPTNMTLWTADPGVRIIFTSTTNTPPTINLPSYFQLDGVWLGGTRIENPTGIFMGGSPISRYVWVTNCTIFGYHDGLEVGSAEYYLIQGDRFVNTGGGTFDHSIYASGNDNHDGTETNHGIIDYILCVAGGGGYCIHCFPANKSMIVTRNGIFGPGSWGVAAYGKAFLIANNFAWRGYQGTGLDAPVTTIGINTNIDISTNSIVENNIVGRDSGTFMRGDLFTVTTNASIDGSIYGCPGCVNTIALSSADNAANVGLSTTAIDNAVAALKASFAQDLTTILNDATIETNFAILRMTMPTDSVLYHAGYPWFDANPINIGPDSGAPSTVAGFWVAFRALGLKEYDAYGNLYPTSAISGVLKLDGKVTIQE